MKAPLQLLASDENWASKVPTAPEWNLLEGLHTVLQLPLKVTNVWEMEEEPTINLVIERLVWLGNELDLVINKDLAGRYYINYIFQICNVLLKFGEGGCQAVEGKTEQKVPSFWMYHPAAHARKLLGSCLPRSPPGVGK